MEKYISIRKQKDFYEVIPPAFISSEDYGLCKKFRKIEDASSYASELAHKLSKKGVCIRYCF